MSQAGICGLPMISAWILSILSFISRMGTALLSLSVVFTADICLPRPDTAVPMERAAHALDTWGSAILRLAYSYLHNMEDAEDILQDTLVQYLRKAPAFENDEHEKAWLLRVASNLSKNRIKYNRIHMTDELSDELAAENRDDLSFVWDAVKALPEKYSEVVHLFYQEGLPTARIAEILHERESTIRSRLNRARGMLRETLREAYDFGV